MSGGEYTTSRRRARSNITVRQLLDWLAKKLFWFLFIPVMATLSYYTQIRPYLLENHGLYVTGFVDGAFVMLAILIFAFWLVSKLLPKRIRLNLT